MNRNVCALAIAMLLVLPVSSAWSADVEAIDAGKHLYQYWCLPCHGRLPGRYGIGQPGTTAIQVKYQGKMPPVLEDRTDLTAEFVAVFVRQGANTMPFFRKTEISDAELAAIGAYLSRNNQGGGNK